MDEGGVFALRLVHICPFRTIVPFHKHIFPNIYLGILVKCLVYVVRLGPAAH